VRDICIIYLRLGGCFRRCLSAELRKNYVDFHEIRWKGGTCRATEETIKFWRSSGSITLGQG